VKNAIRLLVFIFVSFILIFALSAALSFLLLWIQTATTIPAGRFITLKKTVFYLRWTVSFSFYLTLLLSTNYALQNKIHRLVSFLMICALTGGLSFAVWQGLSMADKMDTPPFLVDSITLGSTGLILRGGSIVTTLVDSPSLPNGGRVISSPGQPLFYEADPSGAAGGTAELPPAPFSLSVNWLFESLYIDSALSGAQVSARFESGTIPFISWILPLMLLLVSLSFVFDVGAWPLSNLFLGAVIYRLTLWFEVFINSKDIQIYLNNFFRGMVPLTFISPLIFATLGILLLLYVILMYLAGEKAQHGTL
jgi:hypothetical protein